MRTAAFSVYDMPQMTTFELFLWFYLLIIVTI